MQNTSFVFAGQMLIPLGPLLDYFDSWGEGLVGCSLMMPPPVTTPFNGTGLLYIFEFEIVAPPPPEGNLTSELIISWVPEGAPGEFDTILKNSTGATISFVGIDGYFEYSWRLFGDLNKDGIVDIDDIMVAALSIGSYPEHPRWNPIADLTKDGIVDIDDVMLVALHFGEHI